MITNEKTTIRVVRPSFIDRAQMFHGELVTTYVAAGQQVNYDWLTGRVLIDEDSPGIYVLHYSSPTYLKDEVLVPGTCVYEVDLPSLKHKLVLTVQGATELRAAKLPESYGVSSANFKDFVARVNVHIFRDDYLSSLAQHHLFAKNINPNRPLCKAQRQIADATYVWYTRAEQFRDSVRRLSATERVNKMVEWLNNNPLP